MKNKLDRVEARLRTLFEEQLPSLFSGENQRLDLLDELFRVMKDNLTEVSEGMFHAPDRFTLSVSPQALSEWQTHQVMLDEMAAALYEMGLDENFSFNHPPEINILSDPAIHENEFSITAVTSHAKPALSDTSVMTQTETEHEPQALPENAFLVVGGKMNFPLEKPVINIGRHSDNDLILDDPHVSRHHAQLRSSKGRFLIFDVDSCGGLFINGRKLAQATLQAGDVIRLGVTNLIYVQDSTGELPTSAIPVDPDEHSAKGDRE